MGLWALILGSYGGGAPTVTVPALVIGSTVILGPGVEPPGVIVPSPAEAD